MRRRLLPIGLLVAGAIAGCGGDPTPGPETPTGGPDTTDPTAPTSGQAKQLQGTWEIVRYESVEPIPNEAMPLMGELFDRLRIRFEGATVSAGFEGSDAGDEQAAFQAEEDGEGFKLRAKGVMFDGASCKFVGDDEWEAVDKGPQWAGTSRLRRVKK